MICRPGTELRSGEGREEESQCVYLDLLSGVVDVPGDLGQAALGLGQQVQLGLVHLVSQAADLAVLLSHQ